MYTISNQSIRVGAGNTVTVFGGVFNALCVVNIGNKTVSPLDVGEDFICFTAPSEPGNYTVTISGGGTSSPNIEMVVTSIQDQATWRLPIRGNDEFKNLLIGLMPKGFAWNVVSGTNFYKLFVSVAAALFLIYEVLANLVKESSPLTCENSLDLWERELGLPKSGLQQPNDDGRKREIVRISRQKGGATIPHFKQLLELYGADAEIYEYWKNPSVFPAWVANEGEQAKFYVQVKVYLKEMPQRGFTCNSNCNDRLGNTSDKILESLIKHDKPSHVKFIFTYFVRVLTDETNHVLTDENNRLLIV